MTKKNLPSTRQLLKWVNALRSGEYKQAIGHLHTTNGYCCLGVACEIFIPKAKLIMRNDFIDGRMPPDQPQSPEWLDSIDGKFKELIGEQLPRLNDKLRFTFDEIADCLILFGLEEEIIK